jgi:hypothetical protein
MCQIAWHAYPKITKLSIDRHVIAPDEIERIALKMNPGVAGST